MVEFKGFVSRSNPSRLINTSKRWQNGSSRQCVIRRWGLKRGVRYTFANMVTSAGEGARFQFASDQSLLVYFDQPKKKGRARARLLQSQITLHAHQQVMKLLRLLELEPVAGCIHLHPTYCFLLVKF